MRKTKEEDIMKRFLLIFLSFTVASILISLLGFDLTHENYWSHHGLMLLIFLSFFPRLALLFSSIPFGGLFWWVGLFFFPRYLIAILATINYWHENPVLVSLSWVIAIGGESTEKYYIKRKIYYDDDNVIDVEAHEKD